MKRARLLTGFWLFAVSAVCLAQDRAFIEGDAEDKQDNPIAGAEVTLTNDALGVNLSATTNSVGYYSFPEVPPGDGYIISASAAAMKFSPPAVKFEVEVGETRHLLPSFIGEKAPAPVSRLQRLHKGDVSYETSLQFYSTANRPDIAGLLPASYLPRWNNPMSAALAGISGDAQAPANGSNSGQASAQSPAPQTPTSPRTPPSGGQPKSAVESSRAPLDTLSPAVSTVVTSNQLRNLPLYNRNFLAVGLLVSSTHDVPAWSELKDTTFSISGQRPTSNAFLLDGMDNEATSSNQAIPFQVNDAIQEFRVTTANSDAQFGRNIGGAVNIVTRRGTSQFHGSVFGFFATDSINATSPLSVYGGSGFEQAAAFAGPVNSPPAPNANGSGLSPIWQPSSYNEYVSTIQYIDNTYSQNYCAAPNATPANCLQYFNPAAILAQNDSHTQPFSSQQFGAQAGGSFLKKWYWFGDYEGTRINNPNPIFERVPSSYDRSHLSEFTSGTSGYQDAAIAQAVLSLYPQSNVQAIPDVLEFYRGTAPNYTNVDNYLARLDFNQTQQTNWTFRYNLQHLSQLHDDTLPSSTVYPGNGALRNVLNQNLVGTFTHRTSNNATNVFRAGFTQFQVQETPQDANLDPTKLGLPAGQMQTFLLSGLDPQYAGAATSANGAWAGWNDSVWNPPSPPASPIMTPSLDGLFPFARIGAPLSAPGTRQDRELQLVDNVVWFKGKHTVRAGIDLRWLHNVFDNGGFSRGMVVSSDIGEFTSDSETCVSCLPAAFSSPSFDYALKQPTPFNTTFTSHAIGVYGQDTWRLRPNLTINIGLRYEYFSNPLEAHSQIWNYDPTANGLLQQGGTQVLDPYGAVCGQNVSIDRSVYGARALPWDCKPVGNGNFLVASLTNFEPRLGIAWSTQGGNTVVRAGFGIFYDEVPVSLIAQLAFNRPVQFSKTNPQAIYDQNYNSFYCPQSCGWGNSSLVTLGPLAKFYQDASIPFGLSAIDPNHFSNPLTRQVNFSVGHQISRNTSAELFYIGNFVENLPLSSNTGFNNEWFCTASAQHHLTNPCDAFSFLPIFTLANIGYGNYNAFVAKFTAKGWHGLQTRVSYTYSKALDNGSQAGAPLIPGPLMTQLFSLGFNGTASPLKYALGVNAIGLSPPPVFVPGAIAANFSALTGLLTAGVSTTGAGRVVVTPYTIPQDPYNFLTNDYGRSDYDQTNRFILEYTWDVPTTSRSMWLTGWMLSGVFIAESGQPFTIFAGPVAGELTQRVDLSGPLTMTGNPNHYIGNVSAITLPGMGCEAVQPGLSPFAVQATDGIRAGFVGTPCLGTSARNQFTGPTYVDYDMAVQKMFKIHEALALSLRAESYNLFNHPNYYNPISTYSLDGVTQYSQFGQIKLAHNPRQFQFAVRLNW